GNPWKSWSQSEISAEYGLVFIRRRVYAGVIGATERRDRSGKELAMAVQANAEGPGMASELYNALAQQAIDEFRQSTGFIAVLAGCAVSPDHRSPAQRGEVWRKMTSGSPTQP